MSKHSVGTWNFHAKLSGSENHRGFNVYAQPSGWYIADVSPIDEDGAEGKANARLIAAAPDLLAACQAMAEWDAAENQLPPYDSDNGASFDQCMALCRDAFDKARAAIAKATGEQS